MDLFSEGIEPTVDDTYLARLNVDGRPCDLEIIDTAGREKLSTLREQHIRDSDAFILVYDVTSRSSFSHIGMHYDQIIKSNTSRRPPPPIIIVSNKHDQSGLREVSLKDGQKLARDLHCEFVDVSAKSNAKVQLPFYTAVRLSRQNKGWIPRKNWRKNLTKGLKTYIGGWKHDRAQRKETV